MVSLHAGIVQHSSLPDMFRRASLRPVCKVSPSMAIAISMMCQSGLFVKKEMELEHAIFGL
jgi:hypothetical protein